MRVFAVLILAVPLLLAGCPGEDDAAVMAQQMAARRGGSTPRNTQTRDSNKDNNEAAKTPLPGEAEAGEEGEVVEEVPAYDGPIVYIEKFEVKAPYPEFTGAGRYDVNVEVLAAEPVPRDAFWDIILWKETKGETEEDEVVREEVGRQLLQLVIPHGKPKPLNFYAFYSTAMPDAIEFRLSDKEASDDSGQPGAPGGSRESGSGRGGRSGNSAGVAGAMGGPGG